jgi:hypothetical protein
VGKFSKGDRKVLACMVHKYGTGNKKGKGSDSVCFAVLGFGFTSHQTICKQKQAKLLSATQKEKSYQTKG